MKRRDFISLSSIVGSGSFLLNAIPAKAFSPISLLDSTDFNDRILVVIQMKGGNDGLNTFIPLDYYGSYQVERPNIHIPEVAGTGSGVHWKLFSGDMGIHSNLTISASGNAQFSNGFKSLFDQDRVHIIQGVGYPNPNRSHFKSADIMLSGVDGNPSNNVNNYFTTSGWIARYLEYSFDNLLGAADPRFEDPLGLQLGGVKPSFAFHANESKNTALTLAGQNPAMYANDFGDLGLNPVDYSYLGASNMYDGLESKMQHLELQQKEIDAYAATLQMKYNASTANLISDALNHKLAEKLNTVTRLIHGGAKTKIYLVDMTDNGGFDTHEGQFNRHNKLMKTLSESLTAFQEDLKNLNLDHKVMTVAFSEFGRKISENSSQGTDHGTVGPMIVIGGEGKIKPGYSGTNVNFSLDRDDDAPACHQHDYREVFAQLLKDWLGASDDALCSIGLFPFYKSMGNSNSNNPTPTSALDLIEPPAVLSYSAPGSFMIEYVPAAELGPSSSLTGLMTYHSVDGVRLLPGTKVSANSRVFDGQSLLDGCNEAPNSIICSSPPTKKAKPSKKKTVVEAFPNPVIDSLTIAFSMAQNDKKIRIELFNNQGKLITVPLSKSTLNDGYHQLQFDMTKYVAGIYYVRVTTDQNQETIKIIKQ